MVAWGPVRGGWRLAELAPLDRAGDFARCRQFKMAFDRQKLYVMMIV